MPEGWWPKAGGEGVTEKYDVTDIFFVENAIDLGVILPPTPSEGELLAQTLIGDKISVIVKIFVKTRYYGKNS